MALLRYENQLEEIESFWKKCKEYKDDELGNHLYTYGYLLPMLLSEREEGRLTKGKYYDSANFELLCQARK